MSDKETAKMSISGEKNDQPVADDVVSAGEAAMADEETEAVAGAAERDDDESAAEAESERDPDPLAAMTAERDEYQEKWLRIVAELDNVRKRSSRELLQSRKFAQADVLRRFLEVQDNFERALQSVGQAADTEAPDSFREGVELIYQRFRDVMKEQGVEPIEALEAEFDPNFHDAVGQLPREGVDAGIVIEVVQQGYHFGDMVLRPARVIISA
jgi:molecular chaperone GrpE